MLLRFLYQHSIFPISLSFSFLLVIGTDFVTIKYYYVRETDSCKDILIDKVIKTLVSNNFRKIAKFTFCLTLL